MVDTINDETTDYSLPTLHRKVENSNTNPVTKLVVISYSREWKPDKNSLLAEEVVNRKVFFMFIAILSIRITILLFQTQVVELQNRVGGRTKTLRAGFSDGLYAEGIEHMPIYSYLSLKVYTNHCRHWMSEVFSFYFQYFMKPLRTF